jgi:hypothetical protein
VETAARACSLIEDYCKSTGVLPGRFLLLLGKIGVGRLAWKVLNSMEIPEKLLNYE